MARTEYSVEIRDSGNGKFIRQIDVFDTYEKANSGNKDIILNGNEYLDIFFIKYDADGDETDYGRMEP